MIDQIVVSRTTLLRQPASEISLCTSFASAPHLAAYPKVAAQCTDGVRCVIKQRKQTDHTT